MCWVLKRFKKKNPSPAGLLSVEVWNPEIFLSRARKLEADYTAGKLSAREVVFELTSLLFEIANAVPRPDIKKIFYHGYQQSLDKWVDLKFNPDYSGKPADIETLIYRYISELRKI